MADDALESQPLTTPVATAYGRAWLAPLALSLALLAVLALSALGRPLSAHALPPVQRWEEIPILDELLRRAQELEPVQVALPDAWNMTECVIDAVQAGLRSLKCTWRGGGVPGERRAGAVQCDTNRRRAVHVGLLDLNFATQMWSDMVSAGGKCPENSPAGCAAPRRCAFLVLSKR